MGAIVRTERGIVGYPSSFVRLIFAGNILFWVGIFYLLGIAVLRWSGVRNSNNNLRDQGSAPAKGSGNLK